MRKLLFIVLVGIVSIAQSTAQEKEYLIINADCSANESWMNVNGTAVFTPTELVLQYTNLKVNVSFISGEVVKQAGHLDVYNWKGIVSLNDEDRLNEATITLRNREGKIPILSILFEGGYQLRYFLSPIVPEQLISTTSFNMKPVTIDAIGRLVK